MSNLRFTHCLAVTYVFLEDIDLTDELDRMCKQDNPCSGCSVGNCKKTTAVKHVAYYYVLFDTMSGCNSIRCRFDGELNEMEKLIVGIKEQNAKSSCGTDYTGDFLFGYIGYEYRKCTDTAVFKNEIIASIDAGKPVIAEVKSGKGCFHLITGYDGDTLICPDYGSAWDKPTEPPKYDELVTLYITGDKIVPHYSLKDGLERIKKVMEYNINEKFWDEYLVKMGGWGKFVSNDGLDKVNSEELKFRMQRMKDTLSYTWDSHQFRVTFRENIHEKWHREDCYKEMRDPALNELWNNIYKTCGTIVSIGHMSWRVDWSNIDPSNLPDMSMKTCEAIVKFKKTDIKLLSYINQAISLLDSKREIENV